MFEAAAAKSLQSCPTLCDPMDGSLPGSPVPGNLQARTLEWVAISFSNAWKWKVKVKSLSHVWLSATLWTAAYQAPPSMGFSRQEYWSGVPLPSPVWSREGPYWRDLWAWLLPLGMACNLKSTKFYKVVPRIPRQQAEEALQLQIQDTSKEKERQPREKSWESE